MIKVSGIVVLLPRLFPNYFKRTTMVFACQKDSYRTEYTTKVVSCWESCPDDQSKTEYEIILDDTVLFPEGGGQVSKSELIYISQTAKL